MQKTIYSTPLNLMEWGAILLCEKVRYGEVIAEVLV